MKEAAVIAMLKLLGSPLDHPRGDWMIAPCVLAPWNHHKGTDQNPSFAIKASSTGPSGYKCFSCGAKGTLEDLLMQLVYLKKGGPLPGHIQLAAAMQLLANEELAEAGLDIEVLDYEKLKAEHEHTKFVPFEEIWLDGYMKCPKHPYLQQRGVSEEIATWLDCRFDFSKMRVGFPMRTFEGVLGGMQGRLIIEGEPRYYLYDTKGHYNRMLFGNEGNASLDQPLVLCEGFFDLASIARVYKNVICSLTSELTQAKLKRIQDADRIISFYDFGTGGDKARETLDKWCKKKGIPLDHLVTDEETGDPGNETEENIRAALESALEFIT